VERYLAVLVFSQHLRSTTISHPVCPEPARLHCLLVDIWYTFVVI